MCQCVYLFILSLFSLLSVHLVLASPPSYTIFCPLSSWPLYLPQFPPYTTLYMQLATTSIDSYGFLEFFSLLLYTRVHPCNLFPVEVTGFNIEKLPCRYTQVLRRFFPYIGELAKVDCSLQQQQRDGRFELLQHEGRSSNLLKLNYYYCVTILSVTIKPCG